MELGERIRQARQEAGLSQRQVCGQVITRNMLSQIEHGAAQPSLDTLRYLAARLGKPVSWLLEEPAVTSGQAGVVCEARDAYRRGDYRGVAEILESYRTPDTVFDEEVSLLRCLSALGQARQALAAGQHRYAARLLREAPQPGLYLPAEMERERLLLLSQAAPEEAPALAEALPADDRELQLRARAALLAEDGTRAAALLDGAAERTSQWQLLRGDAYLLLREYVHAADCFALAESEFPRQTAPRLEICYREMGDYRLAYQYAVRQRDEGSADDQTGSS